MTNAGPAVFPFYCFACEHEVWVSEAEWAAGPAPAGGEVGWVGVAGACPQCSEVALLPAYSCGEECRCTAARGPSGGVAPRHGGAFCTNCQRHSRDASRCAYCGAGAN